jgi:hypothetical protein
MDREVLVDRAVPKSVLATAAAMAVEVLEMTPPMHLARKMVEVAL